MRNIYKIAIDGGPCSGKSVGMPIMADALRAKGYIVLLVPEVATTLINGGITPANIGMYEFQKANYELQVAQEALWMNYAKHLAGKESKDVVILCDRAKLSGEAYLPEFFELLSTHYGVQANELCLEYIGIIHLVSAAEGAEEFYTHGNNSARSEDLEGARIREKGSREAWRFHPNVHVIANRDVTDKQIHLSDKIQLGIQALLSIIGHVEENQSTVEIEQEAKAMLTEEEYLRLLKHIGHTVQKAKEQVNWYFDTADLKLHSHDLMLRTRRKNGIYELTVKEPATDGRKETNHRPLTEAEVQVLHDNGIPPIGNVYDALARLGMNPPFVYQGRLDTMRVEIEYKGCKLALDHNLYLDISDYEIEMEKNTADADQNMLLQDLLAELNIPYRSALSKTKRFFETKLALKTA